MITISEIQDKIKNLSLSQKKVLFDYNKLYPQYTVENLFYALLLGWYESTPELGSTWNLDLNGGRMSFPELPDIEKLYNINADILKYSEKGNYDQIG